MKIHAVTVAQEPDGPAGTTGSTYGIKAHENLPQLAVQMLGILLRSREAESSRTRN